MLTIQEKNLEPIKKLYREGYSAKQIAIKFGVSIDAVYYFFRKHNIPRRTPRENNQLQFQKKKPSFKIKSRLSNEDKILRIAGVMLYWGEGSQWPGEAIVDFANSNSDMVRIFMAFLRRICGIDDSKLRAYLYCYSDQNPKKLIKFWSKITKIPRRRFTKPYIREDFKASKSGKMKNGLIHIRYYDKKLFLLIKDWISEFSNKY